MLRIQLLGSVEASVDDAVLPLGGPKQRTVLAVLAAEPGKPVSSDRLIEAVWGDEVPERASRSLSTYVSNLRGVLGDVIVRDGHGYALVADRSQVDATDFADRVAAAQREQDPALVANGLRGALGLWVGVPFGGVDGNHVLEPEVTRLAELRIAAIESAVEAELTSNGDVDLVELDRLVLEHPHRERIRGLHMRALYSAGRQAEALTSYKAFRDQLATDLGIDPSPELQQLELQILQQDPELSPRTPSPAGSEQGSLPVRYSSFVGRADEIAAVAAAITQDRLVTVVGPGGIGKSSLVVEAARSSEVHRGDTVVRVVIDTLGEGELVDAVVRALGLDPAPGVDPVDLIAAYTGPRPHLLILDGCEAQLDAVADLVDRVLSASPQLRVLAASREPLGLAGETTIRIDGLRDTDAVELFVNRTRLGPHIDAATRDKVSGLCMALDGMPLAIELAAARARSVPLGRVVERLDDLIPLLRKTRMSGQRHDSFAATMAWSYDLLNDAEQMALRWLSAFPTGFDRRDAEAMLEDRNAEDVVARLVDVSLVQPANGSGLHRMLEPVRQFATSMMESDTESYDAGLRHAQWIADEADRAAGDLWSPAFREAKAWLFGRRAEVLRAIKWAQEHGQPDILIQIVAAIGREVVRQGDSSAVLAGSLTAIEDPTTSRTEILAIAMAHTALMLHFASETKRALALLDAASALAAETESAVAEGEVVHRRGTLLCDAYGATTEHLEILGRGIELLQVGAAVHAKEYVWNQSIFLARLGRFDEAEAAATEHDTWLLSVRGTHESSAPRLRGNRQRLSGDLRGSAHSAQTVAQHAHENHEHRDEQGMWEIVALNAVALNDQRLLSEALHNARSLQDRTGVSVSTGVAVRAVSSMGRHEEVLTLAADWLQGLSDKVGQSGQVPQSPFRRALDGDATREPEFLIVLLSVALAFESVGRDVEAGRIAREASNLMEQSNFGHWDEVGEAQAWVELLARLGGGEPDGLTPEEAFYMVHDMLVGDEPS